MQWRHLLALELVSVNVSSVNGGCLVPGISTQIYSSASHTSFSPKITELLLKERRDKTLSY